MNTKEMQQVIAKQQVNKGHVLVCENLSMFFPFEIDVLSVTGAGFAYEFEVKISRADYKKDSEKIEKHSFYKQGAECKFYKLPNYFAYCCPPGLIKGHEIPSYSGLYYVQPSGLVQEIIKAPLIHKNKPDLLQLALKINRVTSERLYLGGCKLTVKNNEIKARNRNVLAEAGFSAEEISQHLKAKKR